jgi:probable rRNA maturation factor
VSLPLRKVEVAVDGVRHPRWESDLPRFCSRALREAGYASWDISFLLCGDRRITELNDKYRGKKAATDVLSFPREDGAPGKVPRGTVEATPRGTAEVVVGDLAISLDTLRRNAAAFGCTEDEELKRLTVHGLLHLAGMDHGRGRGGPMLELQERLLESLRRVHVIRGRDVRGGERGS